MDSNILDIKNRIEFRTWLSDNGNKQKECFIIVKRGNPVDSNTFYYIDAVEEALCFGWIDSTLKLIDGILYQRFTPRRKNSAWSELNKERVRRLIKLGLMTKEGKKMLPKLGKRSFKIDDDIVKKLKENRCYKTFKSFPELYQNIRAYNVSFYKKDKKMYDKALNNLIKNTKEKKMYGEWNDYGRLLNY